MNDAGGRREQTRAKILKAARTVIAGHGMDDTTIRKIADEAGVSPTLVMQYFGTKGALVQEVFLDSNSILLEFFKNSVDDAQNFMELTMSAIDALLERDLRYPSVTRQVMAFTWSWGPNEEKKFRATLQAMSAIIANSMAARFLPQDEELARSASFVLINSYAGLLRIALQENWPAEQVREAIKPSLRIVMAGLEALAHKPDETANP